MNYSKRELTKFTNLHTEEYIDSLHTTAVTTGGLSKQEAYDYLVDSTEAIKKALLKTELPPACANFCQANDGIVANKVPGKFGFTKLVKRVINYYQP